MKNSKVIRDKRNQLDIFGNDLTNGYPFNSLNEKFETLTYYLMNYLGIGVANRIYRITETEIYYYDEKTHKDPYVHCDEEQLNAGKWYFNGFGLDITFGDSDKNIYGGILIRGIKKIGDEEKYISGPSNVLKELFSSIESIISENTNFRIVELHQYGIKETENIPIQTTRIVLTKKKDDKKDYFNAKYRYIVDLTKEHKFKGKEKVIRNLVSEGTIEKEEVENILGYNINTK
jgi:hypothetical protein